MTPEERGNRIALRQKPEDNLANRAGIIRAIQDAIAEEREAAIAIIRTHLLHDSQRAVSWHEVQDAIAAIRAR